MMKKLLLVLLISPLAYSEWVPMPEISKTKSYTYTRNETILDGMLFKEFCIQGNGYYKVTDLNDTNSTFSIVLVQTASSSSCGFISKEEWIKKYSKNNKRYWGVPENSLNSE